MDILRLLIYFLALIVIIKILMDLANWIGELLGIGNFVVKLLQKIGKK